MTNENLEKNVQTINEHIATVLLSRIATLIGIPAIGFLAWIMYSDLHELKQAQNDTDRKLFLMEYQLNQILNAERSADNGKGPPHSPLKLGDL